MTTQLSTGPRPRTEAGRRLIRYVVRVEDDFGHEWDVTPSNAVLAIEAEARAAALTAVEEAVRGLDWTPLYAPDADDMCPNCVTPWKCNGPHEPPETDPVGFSVDADRVLAVLAKLQEDEQ